MITKQTQEALKQLAKTPPPQWNPEGGCVRRAFETGLRYMGRTEDLSWIPDSVVGSQEIWAIAERLGLQPLKTGHHKLDLIPAVVAYHEEGDDEGHAVFISDILPLTRQYKIIAIVIGFDGETVDATA